MTDLPRILKPGWDYRPHQAAAIRALREAILEGSRRNLVVVPTGGGKSLIAAALAAGTAAKGRTFLMLTHRKELIGQNAKTLQECYGIVPAIHSAGLGLKQGGRGHPVTYAGIQSYAPMLKAAGWRAPHVDHVCIDEAHLVPFEAGGQYARTLNALAQTNPDVVMTGLTATPYRLGRGYLHEGDDRRFDAVAYEIAVADLVADGTLVPLRSFKGDVQIDVSGLKRGASGDYSERQVAERAEGITPAALAQFATVLSTGGSDGGPREAGIVFASGIAHADACAEILRGLGVDAASITMETPDAERTRLVRAHREGGVRVLCGADVLTTGYDCPRLDTVAVLRATASTGLFVQSLGRGARSCEPTGKVDCVVLDFGGNFRRHGTFDAPTPPRKKGQRTEPGEAPTKTCPECATEVAAGVRECPWCHHQFPERDPEAGLETEAYKGAASSSDVEPWWITVRSARMEAHTSMSSGNRMIRTTFRGQGGEWVADYMSPEASPGSRLRRRFERVWPNLVLDDRDPPATIDEALTRRGEIAWPREIQVRQDGKYLRILKARGRMPRGGDLVDRAARPPTPNHEPVPMPDAWADLLGGAS